MSHPGYMCLGGMEIVNNERTSTYAANGWKAPGMDVRGCYSCGPDMALALGQAGGVYSNPGTDQAPWFSTTEPDSIDFGGLLVTSVDGLGPGVYSRTTTPRASGRGSFLGPGVQASPVITVRGVLIGRTCCSIDYGLRWLNNVLRGGCGSDCDGDDLEFLDCCPELCEDSPEFTNYEDCLEPYIRTLKGVSLVRSPVVVDRFGSSCGCNGASMVVVEFVLSASEPCVYRTPQTVESGVLFDGAASVCHTWIPTPEGTVCSDDECQDPADCLADPACPPPPKPPVPPAAINPCVCTPIQTVTACINMPADMIPEYAEGVPIIEISSGSRELRQIQMRFMLNPLGVPVSQLNPCDACGEVTLSHIPANSVFRMDGMDGTVTIECPGSAITDATPLLGTRGGRLPFRYPEIQCGGVGYTMCVEVDAATVAEDASIALAIAIREC